MNALRFRPLAQHVVRQQQRTIASKVFPQRNQHTFKENWLSDPSIYPLLAIMAGGLTFVVAMTCNALFTYKQLDINPNQRCRIMKQYSPEHRVGVTEKFTMAHGGVKPEGVGIDHDQWVKEKEEYLKK